MMFCSRKELDGDQCRDSHGLVNRRIYVTNTGLVNANVFFNEIRKILYF